MTCQDRALGGRAGPGREATERWTPQGSGGAGPRETDCTAATSHHRRGERQRARFDAVVRNGQSASPDSSAIAITKADNPAATVWDSPSPNPNSAPPIPTKLPRGSEPRKASARARTWSGGSE